MKTARPLAAAALLLAAALPAWAQTALPDSRPQTAAAAQGRSAEQDALQRLAQSATTAQQMGNLAADKNTPRAVALLGDEMVRTNSELNRRLDAAARDSNVEMPAGMMPPEAQARFEQLRKTNQKEFASGLTDFIRTNYPAMIEQLQALAARGGAYQSLAQDMAPRLQNQLDTATQLAQADFEGPAADAPAIEMNRNLPVLRKDSEQNLPPGSDTQKQ